MEDHYKELERLWKKLKSPACIHKESLRKNVLSEIDIRMKIVHHREKVTILRRISAELDALVEHLEKG